ncbi:MAG: hypothetical protein V3S30_03415, partial [Thermoanaerobaculia bacterium]
NRDAPPLLHSPLKHLQQVIQLIPADGQNSVDGGLEFDFPFSAGIAVAEFADTVGVDEVIIVNADEAVGLEGGGEFAEGTDVAEELGAAATDKGFVTVGCEVVDVVGVDGSAHKVAEVNQDKTGACHFPSIIGRVDLRHRRSI